MCPVHGHLQPALQTRIRAGTIGPMALQNKAALAEELAAIELSPEDAEVLTPKEQEKERLGLLEERRKRSWMDQTALQLAGRIPVSVFALGVLATQG
jgi:hypothetical protein